MNNFTLLPRGKKVWKYESKLYGISFTNKGEIYLYGQWHDYAELHCLDLESGKEIRNLKSKDSGIYLQDGKAYIESGNTIVHCLDLETGKEIWSYICYPAIDFAIANKKIYLLDDRSTLHCIDGERGEKIWEVRKEDKFLTGFYIIDKRIFIVTDEERELTELYSLEADTGIELGKFIIRTASVVFKSLKAEYMRDNKILISVKKSVCEGELQENDILYCINEETGKEIWKFITPSLDDLYITHKEAKVYAGAEKYTCCLDLETGKEIWQFPSSPEHLLIVDRRIYIKNTSGPDGMYCLDKETGEKIWEFNAPLFHYNTPVANGKIYLADRECIYCLNLETGEEIWKLKHEKTVMLDIIAGRLFVRDEDYLYCLDT